MIQSTTKRYTAHKNNIDTLKISDSDLINLGANLNFI